MNGVYSEALSAVSTFLPQEVPQTGALTKAPGGPGSWSAFPAAPCRLVVSEVVLTYWFRPTTPETTPATPDGTDRVPFASCTL